MCRQPPSTWAQSLAQNHPPDSETVSSGHNHGTSRGPCLPSTVDGENTLCYCNGLTASIEDGHALGQPCSEETEIPNPTLCNLRSWFTERHLHTDFRQPRWKGPRQELCKHPCVAELREQTLARTCHTSRSHPAPAGTAHGRVTSNHSCLKMEAGGLQGRRLSKATAQPLPTVASHFVLFLLVGRNTPFSAFPKLL